MVFEFKISKEFKHLLVEKASILINGVSLTISKIKKESFEIWVIPHTLKLTNLSNIIKNDLVNVEIDILSKYTKKFIDEKNDFRLFNISIAAKLTNGFIRNNHDVVNFDYRDFNNKIVSK